MRHQVDLEPDMDGWWDAWGTDLEPLLPVVLHNWAGLGWAGLGWAGLGWAGLGWAGLGRY